MNPLHIGEGTVILFYMAAEWIGAEGRDAAGQCVEAGKDGGRAIIDCAARFGGNDYAVTDDTDVLIDAVIDSSIFTAAGEQGTGKEKNNYHASFHDTPPCCIECNVVELTL